MKDFVKTWILAKVINLKVRSTELYSYYINNLILDALANVEVEDITEGVVQDFVLALAGKNYSTNTIRACYKVLKNCLVDYYDKNNLKSVKFKNIKIPTTNEKKVECFGEKEQRLIEENIDLIKHPRQLGVLVSLYTGLRLGELLALTWDNVDLKKNLIHIERSVHYMNKKLIYSTPKTQASIRTIPLPYFLGVLLREHKKKSKSQFVLSDKNGKPFIPRTYQYEFEMMLKKLNIPHKGFHALRHTFATRAIECGMDIKSLADILGHSNPMITLKRYTHSMLDYKKIMMNKIGKIHVSK